MKRIIDGRRYDTETATEIATWSNHYGCTDFHHCEESLYRTKRGSWFVAGEGGPLSPYSEPVGNNGRGSGEGLRPLSEAEAREWMEGHGCVDELEENFAATIEDA